MLTYMHKSLCMHRFSYIISHAYLRGVSQLRTIVYFSVFWLQGGDQ